MKTIRELLQWVERVQVEDPTLEHLRHYQVRFRAAEGNTNFHGKLKDIPKRATKLELDLYQNSDLKGIANMGNIFITTNLPYGDFETLVKKYGFRSYDDWNNNQSSYWYVHSQYGTLLRLFDNGMNRENMFYHVMLQPSAFALDHTPDVRELFGSTMSEYNKSKYVNKKTFSFSVGAAIPDGLRTECLADKAKEELEKIYKPSQVAKAGMVTLTPILKELVFRNIPILVDDKGGNALVHLPGVME